MTRPTLRERRRQDLTAEIKAAARARLAADGLAALSLRAVARDIGMAVSALYRYFASRDELVTALLVDAYTAQAEAVEAAAAGAEPVPALRAGLRAFREWSIAHPVEYGLMYGDPLPGYQAPTDQLYRPGTRVATLLYGLVDAADRRGRLDRAVAAARRERLPAAHVDQLDRWRRRRVPDMGLDAVVVTVDLWTRVQGLLTLEVFGQLRPVLPDPAGYYAAALDDALAAAGLTDPTAPP
jgi:AcrR family transcriptional regulator